MIYFFFGNEVALFSVFADNTIAVALFSAWTMWLNDELSGVQRIVYQNGVNVHQKLRLSHINISTKHSTHMPSSLDISTITIRQDCLDEGIAKSTFVGERQIEPRLRLRGDKVHVSRKTLYSNRDVPLVVLKSCQSEHCMMDPG